MSSYIDGPEMSDSEFTDAFDAYFDRYSTRNSQLLRKVDELQIELGRQMVDSDRMRDVLASQENRINQLTTDFRAERSRALRSEANYQRTIDRCRVRLSQQERRNEENEDEIERLLADLYKARRNLPLKRGQDEGAHNILLADMEEEYMMACLSRRNVIRSFIDIQGDGTASLTLLLVNGNHLTGPMRTSHGAPYSFTRNCTGNVWKGDHSGLSIGFGHLTVTNALGRIPLPDRFSNVLERSLDRIRSIHLINVDGTDRIVFRAREARKTITCT